MRNDHCSLGGGTLSLPRFTARLLKNDNNTYNRGFDIEVRIGHHYCGLSTVN
jgi:hypothetical protein